MDILCTLILCLVLVVAATWLHYQALRAAAIHVPQLPIRVRRHTLVVVALATVAHLAEIGLYALGYVVATRELGIGRLTGALENNGTDFIYFSAATFTTLGVGDIVAQGPLRLLVSVQALNGLVLITWSASYTYLSMAGSWTGTGARSA